MLKQTPLESRGQFLLEFTKQLIKNNKESYIYRLDEILSEIYPEEVSEEKTIYTKDEIKKRIKKITEPISKKEPEEIKLPPLPKPIQRIPIKRILRIPEPRLPPTLIDLKPTATKTNIDLKKLNPLIQDPNVKEIEVQGPETNVLVKGTMGKKPTGIKLTKEEIQETLTIFSKKTMIPLSTGTIKMVTGNLELTAIIEKEHYQFKIKKIPERQSQPNIPRRY